ncbi:MAG: hypothetical protein ACXWNJ_18105 [Vulcanimicrobiaceae bacterium]
MALLKNELSVSVFVTAVWPGEKSDWSKLEGRATITVFNDCTLIAAVATLTDTLALRPDASLTVIEHVPALSGAT